MKKEKSVRQAEIKAAVIKQLKSLIVPVILCAIILVGVFVVINYKNVEEKEPVVRINGYEGSEEPVIMENDRLKFVMDPITTQFSLEVKDTGKVWYSNPQDAADDKLALAAEKDKLQATLLMSYSIVSGLESQYDNYQYSIKNGIYDIETGDDYVKVNYSIGKVDREYVIPPVSKAAEFDAMTEAMSKDAFNLISRYYKKYDINKLGKKDDKDALLASYPILETEPIYVLRDNASSSVKTKMEEFFAEYGYTYEQFQADRELNLAEATSNDPVFNVNMTYRLEDGDLKVEMALKELQSESDYPIYTLTPLPYFGAGGTEDTGYLLVPEGGGAIINFNNGKLAQNSYYANMYGWDMALSREALVHNTRAYYNTFGVSQENDSFLCILEEGAPYASIQADISGHNNSYNYANAVYSITLREQYDVGAIADSAIYTYLPELPDETLTLRYRFVDSGSYVDMAKVYQGYLKDEYSGSFTPNDDSATPVAVEVVGAVDKVKQVLGMPTRKPVKLTTYKEAEAMVTELQSDGISNMSVKLSGWCNGGVNQKLLKKIKTVSSLGSKKDLQSFLNNAKALGITAYLDGVTDYEYDSDLLDGFFSYRDAARFISKERAEIYQYSDVTYAQREGSESYYLLHADLRQKMRDNLISYAQQNGAGVSFRDVGMDLSADYYTKKTVSRQETMTRQVDRLKKMSEDGTKVMINTGNDYAAVYSDMITNMDLQGNEYTILDAYVPFYQLALHGYVNYTGNALNVTGNAENEILLSAEYGAGLSFTIMRESPFALQKTLYTEYYGADYATCHDRILEIYNRYNEELGHIFNQEMTDHECITSELKCTTYADGTKVYVNYSYADAVTPDGVEVPARDYKVVR